MPKSITKLADQFAPCFATIAEIFNSDPELYARIKYVDNLLQEALIELERIETEEV